MRVWDVAGGAARLTLKHTAPVLALALSPDGGLIAAGSQAGTLRLWESTGGKEVSTHTVPGGPITSLAFAPDGMALAAGNRQSAVTLVDRTTGKPRATVRGHAGPVHAVAFVPGSPLLASAGEDGAARLWSVDGHQPKEWQPPPGHRAAVRAVEFAGDDRMLVTAGADSAVMLWDVMTGRIQHTLAGPAPIAVAPDGQTLALAGPSGRGQLWDLRQNTERAALQDHPGSLRCLAISADGRLAAGNLGEQGVGVWDVATGQLRIVLRPAPATGIQALAFAPNRRMLAGAGADQTVRLWDVTTGQERTVFQSTSASALAFAADRRTLFAASGLQIKRWDGAAQQERPALDGHRHAVTALARTADGRWLASADAHGRIILWDLSAGKPARTWQLPGPVYHLAFAADGRHLATANANGTAYVLRLPAERSSPAGAATRRSGFPA